MPSQDLGAQEQAVLDLIVANPFIGQKEIAAALGLARSTVAVHVSQLIQKGYLVGRGYILPTAQGVVCIGGATVDRSYHSSQPIILGTSNPAQSSRGFGGVGRNVAENLARLGVSTTLVTIVGEDANGRALLSYMRNLGVDMAQTVVDPVRPTAEYTAVIGPDSELLVGIADMDILDHFLPSHLEKAWSFLSSSSWVFAECNLSREVISTLVTRRPNARFRLALDTVSEPKAKRLPDDLSHVDLLFTNLDEACAYLDQSAAVEEAVRLLLARGAQQVVLTRGAEGAVLGTSDGVIAVPAVPANPIDVTGAGDAMIAATITGLVQNESITEAVASGVLLSALTTETNASVHPELSMKFLSEALERRKLTKNA